MSENTVTLYVNTRNNTQHMCTIASARQQWLHSSSEDVYEVCRMIAVENSQVYVINVPVVLGLLQNVI